MAPSTAHAVVQGRAVPNKGGSSVQLGTGSIPGRELNNAGFLALFAILGGAMVLAAIYFFFLARNGGFRRITREDWDDYKSTVLRRKGPDGKTLSNATKSTRLGGGSVVPRWARTEYDAGSFRDGAEMAQRRAEEGTPFAAVRREVKTDDPELAAYKHEKAAKVGGINTGRHGSQWDASNTDRSAASASSSSSGSAAAPSSGKKSKAEKKKKEEKASARSRAKKAGKPERRDKADAAAAQPGSTPTETSTAIESPSSGRAPGASERHDRPSIRQVSTASASYYDAYRPAPQSSRSSSPSKKGRGRPSTAAYTAASGSEAASEGTKVYRHHIPGLSEREVAVEDSVSQVAGRRARREGGYRRARGDEF